MSTAQFNAKPPHESLRHRNKQQANCNGKVPADIGQLSKKRIIFLKISKVQGLTCCLKVTKSTKSSLWKNYILIWNVLHLPISFCRVFLWFAIQFSQQFFFCRIFSRTASFANRSRFLRSGQSGITRTRPEKTNIFTGFIDGFVIRISETLERMVVSFAESMYWWLFQHCLHIICGEVVLFDWKLNFKNLKFSKFDFIRIMYIVHMVDFMLNSAEVYLPKLTLVLSVLQRFEPVHRH